jgi:hypothetical protein
MKKIIIIFSFLFITGCAQTGLYNDEQQARVMSDWYLCKHVNEAGFEEIRTNEVIRRGINCKEVLDKKEARVRQEREDYLKKFTSKPKGGGIYNKVLRDSIDQYNIARTSGGSNMDLCVQAGMVKAAALQAKNQEYYSRWNSIEQQRCSIAGLPRY